MIVQDAQTANSTSLGLPGAFQPHTHVLKLLSLQLRPPPPKEIKFIPYSFFNFNFI